MARGGLAGTVGKGKREECDEAGAGASVGSLAEVQVAAVVPAANPFGVRAVPVGFSFRKIVLDLAVAAKARQALKNGRYLAIQASEEAAFLAVMLGRGRGLPIIYDMQSNLREHLAEYRIFRLPPVQWLLKRCERWLTNRVDVIITSAGLGAHAAGLAPDTPVREWKFHAPNDPVALEEVDSLRARLAIPAGARAHGRREKSSETSTRFSKLEIAPHTRQKIRARGMTVEGTACSRMGRGPSSSRPIPSSSRTCVTSSA